MSPFCHILLNMYNLVLAFIFKVLGNFSLTVQWGQFLTTRNLPLGANFAPRGEICPLVEMFTPLFTPGVNTLYCLDEWRGEQRISPPGDNFTPPGDNSALGSKFAQLRIGLRPLFTLRSQLEKCKRLQLLGQLYFFLELHLAKGISTSGLPDRIYFNQKSQFV
jgi:hypothetical protein